MTLAFVFLEGRERKKKMKYKAIIETDEFKDFKFFEDGNGKYLHAIDAGAVNDEWIALYFTECKVESEEAQPKKTDDSCLNFNFNKVKNFLKKDDLDNLIVDHTCEEKQGQTRDEKMINAIDFAIKVTDSQDDYSKSNR